MTELALLKRIDNLTRRARVILTWERYGPVLAIGIAACLLYMAAGFSGLWERFGDPWRAIALIAALALMANAIWKARRISFPNQSAAARRVERDSGLEHRPFDTVRDRAAATGQADPSLWSEHERRAVRSAANAQPTKRRSVLTPIDPYYLRFVVPCLVVLGLMLGTGDSLERLRRSLSPAWLAAVNANDAKYDAWIDPPDYTGRPPVYFKNKSQLSAPDGSELVARVSGIKDAPRLLIVENGRSRRVSVTRLGPKSFEARTILTKDAKARWRIGASPKTWRIDINPDTPPEIEWTEDPKAGKRDTLDFAYDLSDDFGAVALVLEMQKVNDLATSPDTASVETIAIPLASSSVRRAVNRAVELNLTKHIWAGEKVRATLLAKDFKGNLGKSEPRAFIVPDKIFLNDIAKASVENRTLLLSADGQPYKAMPRLKGRAYPAYGEPLAEERILRAPAPVQRAALLLDVITDSPAGAFSDPVVYLGLKNVQSRLEQAREIEDIDGTAEDLWLIAMRAEFGPLGNAKEAMQAAEAALRSGIAARARQREIDTLFSRYNDAVDRYMDYLKDNAIETDADGGGSGENRDTAEIQRLLEAIEEANRLGDTEGARRALAQLADLLENMQIQMAKGGSGGEGDSSPNDDGLSDEVKEALEDLADVIGEQRELQDETKDAAREQDSQSQQGQSGPSEQGPSNQGQSGSPQSGGETPSAQTLAENQAALQEAIDALETLLKEGGTDMDSVIATPNNTDGSGELAGQDGENGAIGGEAPGSAETDPNAPPNASMGGGGEPSDDSKAQPGAGGKSLSPQEALDAARAAMEESKDALGGQAFSDAAEAQKKAIEALREAAGALIAQGNGAGQAGDGESAGADPFGRESDSADGLATGETDIPVITDRQRARELIEELRRRRSEQNRSQEELDYLERLLERF